jgi:Zn-dependent peptidase ImmA (M78 family)
MDLKELLPEKCQKYLNTFPVEVLNIADELGIDIYIDKEMDDNISGYIKFESGKFMIVINNKHSYERNRFTVAHEIGHFLLHKDKIKETGLTDYVSQPVFRSNQKYEPEEKDREVEANRLAAELLMPEIEFTKIFDKLNSMIDIADYFKVSESAVAVRANVLFGFTKL